MKCKDCANYGCPDRGDGERECAYINGPHQFFGTPTMPFFDWQSFRAEAAKDILCAIISCPTIKDLKDDEGNLISFDKFAATKVAIEYADELVKQLKEKEEK